MTQDSEKTPLSNPLLLLAGGIAAGFALGMLAPLSDVETERLKPVGDEILRRATQARDEVVLQGRAIVVETLAAAKDSAQTHGREAAEHLGAAKPAPKLAAAPAATKPPAED